MSEAKDQSVVLSLPPMPERIEKLPRDKRGYPAFFTASVRPNGEPNFQAIDGRKILRCWKEELCGICGEALGYYKTFIGGPLAAKNRTFGDPPMHEECAKFAVQVCPYIRGDIRRHEIKGVVLPPGLVSEHPGQVCLYTTRKHKLVREGDGVVFRAESSTRIEWIDMRRGT